MPIKKVKTQKLTGHEQVMNFLEALEHPLKSEIEVVRGIILEADNELSEHIKWNAPSFQFNNEDRITFNFHGKDGFRLIFHCGSKVTEYAKKGPLFEDDTNILEWVTGDRAIVKFRSMNDVEVNKMNLIKVINKWIEVTRNI